MRLKFLSAATVLLLTIHCAAAEQIGGEKTFSFVALGDQPYNLPDDGIKFDRLIAAVNKLKPAFTLHVGDIKSARIPCSNEIFNQALAQLQTFEGALVYTIGDNEWTDCHRKLAGGFDPRERLAKLRQVFFADPAQSLGKVPIKVTSQAQAMPAFSTYVENVRFAKNDVLFASVHVPGSNNGFEAQDPEPAKEFFVRDKANVGWIAGAFVEAEATSAKAVVLFMHADFDESRLANGAMPRQSGFLQTLDAIEAGAKRFGKPVLLIHGDEHFLSLTPLRNSNGERMPNVLKLMVYGETLVHAVRVLVDPDSPGVFGFIPLIVPENGVGN